MLTILLKILSTLGIILLCLLGLLALLAVLVLFFPVSYRLYGRRDAKTSDVEAWVRIRWLFGLFKADWRYPEPGRMTAKLFGFTIYDAGKKAVPHSQETDRKPKQKKPSSHKASAGGETTKHRPTEDAGGFSKECASDSGQTDAPDASQSIPADNCQTWAERILSRIAGFFEKIKYTILKICGRIKDIFENFEYYRNLLQDEEIRLLLGHARQRLGKVIKSVRPRKIKADIHFGTGSPDTTGYALGVYGMLSSFLGNTINVTPDFEEAVLEGEIYLAGRITIFVLLMNGSKLLFDRRLRLFIKRLKREDT